jgi:hypothetical protein
MAEKKWQEFFTFDYYDVSKDESAWQISTLDEDEEVELRYARFKPLGVVRAVHRVNTKRKVTSQIWVSADGRVMVDGGLELATLFEDGSIVKTNRRPEWSFFDPVCWKIRSHPKDRHPYALVEGDLAARLAVHLEQVARFEKESPVVVAESMTHHFAARLRDAELRIARSRPEELIVVLVSVTSGMAAMVTSLFAWQLSLTHPSRHLSLGTLVLWLMLGTLAFFIVALPAAKVMFTWVAPWLVRLRPGPPPRPAATLIELARDIPASTVEDT